MNQEIYENLRMGLETAYIDSGISSNLAFNKQVTMGIVGAGNHDFDADYVFATRDTLWSKMH